MLQLPLNPYPRSCWVFVAGEMPFEEYSALLEQCIKEEPEEEPQIDTIGLSMELTEGNEVLVAPSTSGNNWVCFF